MSKSPAPITYRETSLANSKLVHATMFRGMRRQAKTLCGRQPTKVEEREFEVSDEYACLRCVSSVMRIERGR